MTVTVVSWKWGTLFSAVWVNRLRAGLARHLHLPHELVCITDDPHGLDPEIRTMPMPERDRDTPRCRRRVQMFDPAFARRLGTRLLAMDLDIVLVDDITPLIDRPEALVCWRVAHSPVYSGAFLLMDAGALADLWTFYAQDPELVARRAGGSDQPILNFYLRRLRRQPAHWTDADGIVTYYGHGYERFEHLGVGPRRRTLPPGARLVVLGSADTPVLEQGRYDWGIRHWGPPVPRVA